MRKETLVCLSLVTVLGLSIWSWFILTFSAVAIRDSNVVAFRALQEDQANSIIRSCHSINLLLVIPFALSNLIWIVAALYTAARWDPQNRTSSDEGRE
jgi:hypothetical protein